MKPNDWYAEVEIWRKNMTTKNIQDRKTPPAPDKGVGNIWIENTLQRMPSIKTITPVEIYLFNGGKQICTIDEVRWDYIGSDGDIAYWREAKIENSPAMFTSAMKKEYYVDSIGNDLIDDWAIRLPPDQFRAVMLSMVEKYGRRYCLKDAPLTEALKIQDYASRLVQYEQKLENENANI